MLFRSYNLGIEGQSVSVDGIRKHYKDTIIVSEKVCTMFCKYLLNNKFDILQKKLLEDKVRIVIRNVYGAFFIVDDKGNKKDELKEYDADLRIRFPQAYKISAREKKINLLRKTGFLLFNYLSNREKNRFE